MKRTLLPKLHGEYGFDLFCVMATRGDVKGLLPAYSVWYTQASVSGRGSKREPFQCCESESTPTGAYSIPKWGLATALCRVCGHKPVTGLALSRLYGHAPLLAMHIPCSPSFAMLVSVLRWTRLSVCEIPQIRSYRACCLASFVMFTW